MKGIRKDDRCPSCARYGKCELPRLAFIRYDIPAEEFCCNSYERLRR